MNACERVSVCGSRGEMEDAAAAASPFLSLSPALSLSLSVEAGDQSAAAGWLLVAGSARHTRECIASKGTGSGTGKRSRARDRETSAKATAAVSDAGRSAGGAARSSLVARCSPGTGCCACVPVPLQPCSRPPQPLPQSPVDPWSCLERASAALAWTRDAACVTGT